MSNASTIVMEYLCPTVGCILAIIMFSAPVRDLRRALLRGSLGSLNPFPWVIMTGNCFGWCAYAYYTHDPFILAANVPAWILSLWLNLGASKLQYLLQKQQQQQHNNESTSELLWTRQEKQVLVILILWCTVLVLVGWVLPWCSSVASARVVVGALVNCNLVLYFGAPLGTIRRVVSSASSESIHKPTAVTNTAASLFWALYGVAKQDPIIYLPNTAGVLLGTILCVLCCVYQRKPSAANRISDNNYDDDAIVALIPHNESVSSGLDANQNEHSA